MPLNIRKSFIPGTGSNSNPEQNTDFPINSQPIFAYGRMAGEEDEEEEFPSDTWYENEKEELEADDWDVNEEEEELEADDWDVEEEEELEADDWESDDEEYEDEEYEDETWEPDDEDDFEWPDEEEDTVDAEIRKGYAAFLAMDTDEFFEEEEPASYGTSSEENGTGKAESGTQDGMPERKNGNIRDSKGSGGSKGSGSKGSGDGAGEGEKILVTRALDERDLLVKKINAKISAASFVDTIRRNEEKVMDAKLPLNEFEKRAASSYQQIQDLITRFEKIDAAIVASNAKTFIETSFGTYTVAGAIALRSRMKGKGCYGITADFEDRLLKKFEEDYSRSVVRQSDKNKQVQAAAENMRLSILGRDNKGKENGTLEVVDKYVRENTTDLADPLGIKKKAAQLKEKREQLISELDTQIKVSNATTFITIK